MIVDQEGTISFMTLTMISLKNNIASEFPEIASELRQKLILGIKKPSIQFFWGLANNQLYNKLNPDRFKY